MPIKFMVPAYNVSERRDSEVTWQYARTGWWYAVTTDTDYEDAIRQFEHKYGYSPEYIIPAGTMLAVGPLREK